MTTRPMHGVRATHGRSRPTTVMALRTERSAAPPRLDRRRRSATPVRPDPRRRPTAPIAGSAPGRGQSVARAIGRTIVLVALSVLAITVLLPEVLQLAEGTPR